MHPIWGWSVAASVRGNISYRFTLRRGSAYFQWLELSWNTEDFVPWGFHIIPAGLKECPHGPNIQLISLICSVPACFSNQVIQTDQIWSPWFIVTVRSVRVLHGSTRSHVGSFFERINICVFHRKEICAPTVPSPLLCHRVCLCFFLLMLPVMLSKCYSHNDSWYGQKGALRWNLEQGTSSSPMPWRRKHAQPSYLGSSSLRYSMLCSTKLHSKH